MNIGEMSFADIAVAREGRRLNSGLLTFVVGMQYGSEAKGSIVQHLAPLASNAVRTGAVNAGHTIYHEGEVHVMRQLPAAWTNPLTELYLGPGAMISPDVLRREIEKIEQIVPIRDRLMIDPNAHVITDEQIADEAKDDLAERIGSTSARGREGIGVAMADKVLRRARVVQAKDFEMLRPYLGDVSEALDIQLNLGADVLVEGTQGFSLSIDHGDYPYVTSRNATVSALADSIGLNPAAYMAQTIGVVRSFPIRVAGNSGPFYPDSQELSWEEMRKLTGNPDLQAEKTTVTQLERRIATFSIEQYAEACRVNQPTEIALTFADYIDPNIYGKDHLSPKVKDFIEELEQRGIPISLVNTGPQKTLDLSWHRRARLRQAA